MPLTGDINVCIHRVQEKQFLLWRLTQPMVVTQMQKRNSISAHGDPTPHDMVSTCLSYLNYRQSGSDLLAQQHYTASRCPSTLWCRGVAFMLFLICLYTSSQLLHNGIGEACPLYFHACILVTVLCSLYKCFKCLVCVYLHSIPCVLGIWQKDSIPFGSTQYSIFSYLRVRTLTCVCKCFSICNRDYTHVH